MRRSNCLALMLALATVVVGSRSGASQNVPSDGTKRVPLRVLASHEHRLVGAAFGKALEIPGAEGDSVREILAREFAMTWSGRFMKWGWIHPARDSFDFAAADSMVDWAKQHHVAVRGHVLSWYQDVPAWLRAVSPDSLGDVLRDHIKRVVSHYRGKLAAWEVAAEVVRPDGAIRPGIWTDALGLENYLDLAFRSAHAADPKVPLYLNDYSIERIGPKSNTLYAIVRRLKERGVPIDGVGFQGHFMLAGVPGPFWPVPSVEDLVANFKRFEALGVNIQITELDIGVPAPVTDEKLSQQAEEYRRVVTACLQVPACNTVMLSGVYDGNDWTESQFPGWTAPVLYDKQVRPKPAYFSVSDALSGH